MGYSEQETYSEQEAYSEQCQTYTTERFAKIARKIKKFLYFIIFRKMKLSRSNIKKFLVFSQKKAFLIFQETELSYFSGNGTFLIFRERYIQNTRMTELFLYFRKGTILDKIFRDFFTF